MIILKVVSIQETNLEGQTASSHQNQELRIRLNHLLAVHILLAGCTCATGFLLIPCCCLRTYNAVQSCLIVTKCVCAQPVAS